MRQWRKSTWAVLGIAALGALLLLPADWNQIGNDAGSWVRDLFD